MFHCRKAGIRWSQSHAVANCPVHPPDCVDDQLGLIEVDEMAALARDHELAVARETTHRKQLECAYTKVSTDTIAR